jgi:photosystem II stability/assembly factor-like uncharacterized protein
MTSRRAVLPALLASAASLLATAAPAPAVTWKRINSGTTDAIAAIAYRPGGRLTFATSAGKIFTRSHGRFKLQASFPGRAFTDVAFRPSGDVALATADTGHLYRFAGGAWTPIALTSATYDLNDCRGGLNPPAARVTPTDNLVSVAWGSDNVAWVVGAGTGEVLKSVDGGVTWTDVSRQADGTCRVPNDLSDVETVPGNADTAFFIGPFEATYETGDGLATAATKISRLVLDCRKGLTRMAIDPVSPNRISGAGADCAFGWGFSNDSGTTSDFVDRFNQTSWNDLAGGPGVFVVAGEHGAIERTYNGGATSRIPARGVIRHETWRSISLADRADAAVGGDNGVLALTRNLSPRPSLGFTGVRARRSRITIRGRLRVPRGLDPVTACRGSVLLTVKRGHRLIAQRSARIRQNCRFGVTIRLSARRVGHAQRLTVVVRFGGAPQLGVRRRTLHVRVR